MNLILNGQELQSNSSTLSELLIEQGYGDAKVATAINGTLAPASLRDQNQLENGDEIEIVAPMQGG